MSKDEIIQIKADFGVGSRRFRDLANDHRGTSFSDELFDAFAKADAAYEALKTLESKLENES